MSTEGWSDFDTWHKLFDALCNRRGWYGNKHPASDLCALDGKTTRQDFEAAKKKLRVWRTGQRLPRRRNLAALAQLLDVAGDPDLERRWLALYRDALHPDHSGGSAGESGSAFGSARPREARPVRNWMLAGLALLLGSGVVYAAIASGRQAAFLGLPQVSFEGHVRVPLGASHLIHGAIDACGAAPPDWEDFVADLPATSLGELSDGGLARKVARRCRDEVVVRGVRFTGLEPGTAELTLFGDYIRIDVLDVAGQ